MADQIDLFIIDDDPDVIEVLKVMIADYKLNIRTFSESTEALTQLNTISPKIIFLDYSMPEMNGAQFIIKMSENCQFRNTSIYLITGMNLDALKMLELKTLGFSNIIKKPLSEKEIHAALNESIDLNLKKISA